jgi:hypothetical protein
MPVFSAKQKHTAKTFVLALVVLAIVVSLAVYGPLLFTNRASVFSSVLPAGTAACGTSSYTYGNQPSNCLPQGVNLQLHLQNQATTSALSGWTVQLLWNGGPCINGNCPGTTGQIAETVANTPASGNAVTSANLYWSSWSLQLRICHQATACGSTPFGQQEYVSVINLPGGTVPFYLGTQSPTSTQTLPMTVNIVPMAGDIAASNTPISMTTFQLPNGTSVGTGLTCFLNEAVGTHVCYLGSGVYKGQLSLTMTNTYAPSTYPYVAGYTDFSDPTLGKNEGTMSTNLQLEVKQTSGSHPVPTIATVGGSSGFSNGPYTIPGSTPDFIYATPTLSTLLTVNRISGTQTPSGGVVSIQFTFDASSMTTSGDKCTLTFNVYAYYSITWVGNNAGSVNSEAVTQMTQFQLTLQTH